MDASSESAPTPPTPTPNPRRRRGARGRRAGRNLSQHARASHDSVAEGKNPHPGVSVADRGDGGATRTPQTSRELNGCSHAMAALPRHRVEKGGLPPDEAGFAPVAHLLPHPRMRGCSEDDLRRIVKGNDKRRFETGTSPSGEHAVRAVRGHSTQSVRDELIGVELTEEELASLPMVVYGTTRRAFDQIIASGALKRMGRKHIYLTTCLPGDCGVITGARSSPEVFVHVDAPAAHRAGVRFLRSRNNVILTTGLSGQLHRRFFTKAIDARTGSDLLAWDED